MIQNKIDSGSSSSLFIQEHSPMIRIWHWLTFILITATMITVLLNSTLLNQRKNIPVVQELLKSKGVAVTEDQAFAVSREYEDKIWGVHKWIGYGIAFLLLSRILIELIQPGDEKVNKRFRRALGLYKMNDAGRPVYRHYLGTKITYILFYLLLLIMALTGLGLAFGRDLGFTRGLHNVIKEIHSIGQYMMYAFVVVHLLGVIIADITDSNGLVSGMINGNRFNYPSGTK